MKTDRTPEGKNAARAERKRGKAGPDGAGRLHPFLCRVSRAIVRNRDRDELFRALCRAAVEPGPFLLAWIGLRDESGGSVVPFAHAGHEDGFLDAATGTREDALPDGDSEGAAPREDAVVICDDIASDPRMPFRREEALRRGYRSSAAVPLRQGDRAIGTLNLYAAEPRFFGADDRSLLEEAGADISFALDALAADDALVAARTEETLGKSAERLNFVVSNSPAIIYTCRSSGDFGATYVSPNVLSRMGYPAEAFIADPVLWFANIHPEDVPRLFAGLPGLFAKGSHSAEYRFRHGDGSWIWVYDEMKLIRDAAGDPVEILGYRVDVTDRKRLEEEQKIFTSIVENIPDFIGIADMDGAVRFLNKAGRELLGIGNGDDLDGKTIYEYIPPAEHPRAQAEIIPALVRSGTWRGEFQLRHARSGETIPVDMSSILISQTGSGSPLGHASICRDNRDRKRTESELRESEEKFRNLFHLAMDGIFMLDLEGRFLDMNATAHERLGYSREEMLRMNIRDLDTPEFAPRVPDRIAELLSRGHAVFESAHVLKDGSVMPVEVNARVIPFGGRQAFLSVNRDITDRRRAEEDREKLRAQLFQAQKMESVGRLAGGVAHDFNNMLGVILGYADLLLRKLGPEDPHRGKLLEIRNAAQRSADLTRQLLAYARRQAVSPKVLDLNDTVSVMIKMLRRLIGEDIDLVWKPAGGLRTVRIDPAQIDQILANLVVNSRDAIDGVGRISIETANVVLSQSDCAARTEIAPGEYVMLAVSDNGCGMGKDILGHLFEPFFTTKRRGEGTGLGLATVYGIVRQNEGSIDVDSEPGRGTTFRIYLPAFAGKAPDAGAAPEDRPLPGQGETVLLVEDEASILHLGKTMLERLGYTVLAASTVGEALGLAGSRAGDIHLLVTDVVMPDMNGRELAERLRAIRPGLKCMFMSGYMADAAVNRGVLEEGVLFLQKPFTMKEFAAKVREALKQR